MLPQSMLPKANLSRRARARSAALLADAVLPAVGGRVRSVVLCAFAVAATALSAGPAAASSYSHAMVVSGQAGHAGGGAFACATSGAQPRMRQFFNTGAALPSEGYSYCNLKGGIQDVNKAAGQATSHQDIVNTFNGGLNTAVADARAQEGVMLGASASESFVGGAVDAFSYRQSEAAAFFTETLTHAGAGPGYVQFSFTIDGSMIASGKVQGLVFLNYEIDGGPIYTAFVGNIGGGFARAASPTGAGAGVNLAGFTVAPGVVSGSDVVMTFVHSITLGTPFDLTVGLYAGTYASPDGSIVSDFFSTAKLTGISVWDAGFDPIAADFTSASGILYDATGAHLPVVQGGVPEPSAWAMLVLGLFSLGGVIRRRRVGAFQHALMEKGGALQLRPSL